MNGSTRGYAHRVDIAADAAQVWEALTAPQYLPRWCSPDAQISARPGGIFRASVDRVTLLEAHIDVFEPQRRMRLIYLPDSAMSPPDGAVIDDFLLDARMNGTIVRLLGSGIPSAPAWDARYIRLRTSWERAVARLRFFVETALSAGAAAGARNI